MYSGLGSLWLRLFAVLILSQGYAAAVPRLICDQAGLGWGYWLTYAVCFILSSLIYDSDSSVFAALFCCSFVFILLLYIARKIIARLFLLSTLS
jgi:hypothetical protein